MKKYIISIISLFLIYFLHYKNYSYELKKELLLSSYIKGINLADAYGIISIKDNQFYISLKAQTVGLFSIFTKWSQEISSKGIINYSSIQSELYKSEDQRGNKKGHMYIKYKNNYPEIISAQPDPRDDDRRKSIKKELLNNTLDPIIGIISIGLDGACNNNQIVFDGKRKYILKPNFLGKEEISKDHFYNKAFETIKCAFQIEKVAGYTKKELKKYPKNGIIWFRKEKNNLYFPIKIEISSTWGKFVCLIKERKLNSESNNM